MHEDEKVHTTAQSFNRWFSENVGQDETAFDSVVELISILYLRLRLWVQKHAARQLIMDVLGSLDEALEAGEIIIVLADGTGVTMRTAEYYDENPEARDMLIESSYVMTDENDWDISELLE